MGRTSRRRYPTPGSRFAGRLAIAVACIATLAGRVVAQNSAPIAETGRKPATASTGGLDAAVAADDTLHSSPSPAQEIVTGSGNSALPAIPSPRWGCDQQTVTAEPVWRGQTDPTFTFHIRNEGTADLRINATGG